MLSTICKIIAIIAICTLFYALHDRIGVEDYPAAVLSILALVMGVVIILINDDFKRYTK